MEDINMTKEQKNYNPTPVYNRRWARIVLRNQIIKRNGYHNVSKAMSDMFKSMHNREEETND
jgi:hypothetical protein